MSLEQISEWARIDWPAGSKNIHHYSESGIDSIALLRFELAPNELQAFVRSLGFTKPLRPNYQPFPTEQDPPAWWLRQEVNNAVGATVLVPGLCREIYVDQSRQAIYTVYLRTFEV